MGSIRNLMLGAAVVAGGLGLGATTAQAAQVGIYVRGPVAYVPPCPGPGYVWAAGYQSGGYWVPGRWNFAGVRGRDNRFAFVDRDHRAFDHRDYDRGRGGDRFRR